MTHLTPGEFVDAAEGTLEAARLRHVERCERCQRELEALVGVMRNAALGPVPEPSPLFWEQFAARVRDTVAAEPQRPRTAWWSGSPRWTTLVPLGALAGLVLAMVASLPRDFGPPGLTRADRDQSFDLGAPDEASTDAEWRALAEAVGPLEWDTADQAGLLVAPGTTDAAILDLSDDERRELARLVSSEIALTKS